MAEIVGGGIGNRVFGEPALVRDANARFGLPSLDAAGNLLVAQVDTAPAAVAGFANDSELKLRSLLEETNSLLRRLVLAAELLLNQELPDPEM